MCSPIAFDQRVEQILNEQDIEGLRAVGAPPDEYAAEAKLICEALRALSANVTGSGITLGQVKAVVRSAWAKMFGPLSEDELNKRDPAFELTAAEIVRAANDHLPPRSAKAPTQTSG